MYSGPKVNSDTGYVSKKDKDLQFIFTNIEIN